MDLPGADVEALVASWDRYLDDVKPWLLDDC